MVTTCLNKKGGGSANSQPPSPPTNGPFPSKSGATLWRRTMSLSHSTKIPSTIPVLSGPQALREYFAPRQCLRLKEAATCINLSYSRFYRRIQGGTLSLRIRTDEIGERFVLLDDLIDYLFGPSTNPASIPPPGSAKRGPGRPRKEGGAR